MVEDIKRTENKPGRYISASQMNSWLSCPERWRLDWDFRDVAPEGDSATIGKLIHAGIDFAARSGLQKLTGEELGIYIEGGEELTNRAKILAKCFKILDLVGMVDSEKGFVVNLNTKTRAVGYMDFVSLDSYGDLTVTDWKTGEAPKRMPKNAQFDIYGMAAREMYPQAKRIKVEMHYLRTGAKFSKVWTPEQDKKTRTMIRSAGKKMRAGDIEPVTGHHCRSCPQLEYCKPYQAWKRSERVEGFTPTFEAFDFSPLEEPSPMEEDFGGAAEWIDESPPESCAIVTRSRHLGERAMRHVVGEWMPESMPKAGESLHVISDGSFTQMAAIIWALIESDYCLDRVFISTWTIEGEIFDQLIGFFDRGWIKRLHFTYSRHTASRDDVLYARVKAELAKRGQSLRTWKNHSKVTILEAKDFAITISGSANIARHRRYDCYSITNSAELCAFHRKWMTYEAGLYAHSFKKAEPIEFRASSGSKNDASILLRVQAFEEWMPDSLKPDETAHIIHNGDFDYVSALIWVVKRIKDAPDVYLSSWWWSREAFTKVLNLFDVGRIKSLTVVVCLTFTRRAHRVYAWMISELESRGQEHRLWINHSKAAAFITDEDAYCIETSSNFSKNLNIENIDVSRSRVAAELHRGWMSAKDGLIHQVRNKGEKPTDVRKLARFKKRLSKSFKISGDHDG